LVERSGIIDPHGGFRKLKSYQSAEIVYDATVVFCNRLIDPRSRTLDQMVQAARSGRQNNLAAAKRTMREFSQANSDPEAIADLMIYAVECGNRFTLNCGDIDEEFYDGLIDIYAAAIKKILQLPKDARSTYRRRLEKIMESSDGIGWGFHDDLGNLFSRAFPEE